jgi:DNA polymerase IV
MALASEARAAVAGRPDIGETDPAVIRKIIHVDMDAFYASVEQRDDPELKGKPVIVGWLGERSVVCAASYEARKFGVHSAMPASRARRLCPQGVFIGPNFEKYIAVSRQIRAIFERHTPLVEPLSLDEAYLDVTEELTGLPTATEAARRIREEIREETRLTASAGVAPNKFLAKIASDWRKPDGLFVIRPHEVERFLPPLPVRKLPGVGPATEKALAAMGVEIVGHLLELDRSRLVERFGTFGDRLWELARGIDDHPVVPFRPRKSLSAEDTFARDLTLEEVAGELARISEKVWSSIEKKSLAGRTVTVKLRTGDFRTLTRRLTPETPPATASALLGIALELLTRFPFAETSRFRLAGIGLSNFVGEEENEQSEPELFEEGDKKGEEEE